ncbi:MAG: alpha-ketoacid dehydrogenase subunit beta [Erysipelotrichaceae bacterium]|nr:alpha-ketoacid dehydrogenase subunit beta [Erysipelotrichaceae bacterium]MBR2827464.1 alpha-ketoacid dehydrogenase subunit beta [Erysipelotrichaceae bacterium]MBR3352331.1 alpha-ketoacid dehydrogenase subunit beta [Erysipelotrichaceae bacterium]
MFKVAEKHDVDSRANRDAYSDAMLEMMRNNERIVHIDCDLAWCINATRIQKEFPERFFNAGIAEANAVGVACGMEATGMIPFVHSFGVFASRRAFDQAFLSAGYSERAIHIIGSDPGITASFNGPTHMPLEDCGLYLNVPNAIVLDPCDYAQTYALTRRSAAEKNLTYMRLIRRSFRTIYEDGSDFEIGKGVLLREGKDVTIVASGVMVYNAIKAAELLEKQGIDAEVIDMHTWKPLDEELLLKSVGKTGAIVTAENHEVNTGLGSAIANVLAARHPVPQEFIGIHNRYGMVASQDYLEREFGMTLENIAEAAIRAIGRK